MNSPGSGKVETGREKVETTRDRRQNWSFPISTLIFKGLSSNIVLGQTAIIILCDTGSPINGKQKCSFFNQTESHIDNIWMFKERNGVGKKTRRPRFHLKNFCRKEATFQPLVVLRALSSSRLYLFTSVKFSLLSSSGGGELPMNGLRWFNGHQFSLKTIFTFPFITMDPSSPLPTIIT